MKLTDKVNFFFNTFHTYPRVLIYIINFILLRTSLFRKRHWAVKLDVKSDINSNKIEK